MSSDNRLSRFYLPLLCILLPLIYLAPVICSPLSSDDVSNFYLRTTTAGYYTKSIAELANPGIVWFKSLGRFAPISLYWQEISYKYFQDILSYKVFLYVFNFFAIGSFAFFLFSIGKTKLIPYFIVAFAGVVQFRLQFHDPFTSFNAMYPAVSILIFLSASFYVLFLKQGNPFLYVASLLCCTCAVLFSEVGLTLVPVLFLCILFVDVSKKKAALSLLPLLAIALAYVLYVINFRRSVTKFYDGVETSFDIPAMLDVLAKQLFAALPLSNMYRHQAVLQVLVEQLSLINLIGIIGIFGLSLLIINRAKNPANSSDSVDFRLLAMAVTMLVVPAVFIMPSVKYQQTLAYGFGYLPYYIQNFGMATLIACLLFTLAKQSENMKRFVFPVVTGVVIFSGLGAFLFNQAMGETRAYAQSLPLEAQVQSMRKGELSGIPAGSVVLLTNEYMWQSLDVYAMLMKNFTGNDFRVVNIANWKFGAEQAVPPALYVFETQPGDTIYTSLYAVNPETGARTELLGRDTLLHTIRLTEPEKTLLTRFY